MQMVPAPFGPSSRSTQTLGEVNLARGESPPYAGSSPWCLSAAGKSETTADGRASDARWNRPEATDQSHRPRRCVARHRVHILTLTTLIYNGNAASASELVKPSLEVAPTSLLLIYSFQLRSAFNRRNGTAFPNFTHFYPKKERFPPVTLHLKHMTFPTNLT